MHLEIFLSEARRAQSLLSGAGLSLPGFLSAGDSSAVLSISSAIHQRPSSAVLSPSRRRCAELGRVRSLVPSGRPHVPPGRPSRERAAAVSDVPAPAPRQCGVTRAGRPVAACAACGAAGGGGPAAPPSRRQRSGTLRPARSLSRATQLHWLGLDSPKADPGGSSGSLPAGPSSEPSSETSSEPAS